MDLWIVQDIQTWGVENVITHYPNSVAFGYNGELKMIEKAKKGTFQLGGLDQMVTAIHPFQRLIMLLLEYWWNASQFLNHQNCVLN